MLLEQDVNAPIGQRYGRWWAAYGSGGSVDLPLVMADSGHQFGSGPVSYHDVYKGYIDTELARPAGADISARATRIGTHYRVEVSVTNRSGATLSSSNGATVHAIVYEDIKVGVSGRTVRAAAYSYISTPLVDLGTASYVLDTADIAPADWADVHVLALVDYRPGGATGAYDMLQAAFASIAPPSGDFDGDGKSDVLWHHTGFGEVWLWPMNGGSATSQTHVRTVDEAGFEIRSLADHNGDGKADVLWRNNASGMLYLWTMNGSTIAAETYVGTVDTAYDIVGSGDYNGDGKADLLWRHQTNGEVWMWLMNGATPLSQTYIDTVDPAYVVQGSGDLNADGKADLVWRHVTDGDVWVWQMNGATPTVTYVDTVAELNYRIVGVADHTGDGKVDILWHHATRGEVWLWTMNGASRESQTYVDTVPDTNYQIVGHGDYDGDGKADILWHHALLGEVWVWLMNGPARLSQTYVASVPDVGYQVVPGIERARATITFNGLTVNSAAVGTYAESGYTVATDAAAWIAWTGVGAPAPAIVFQTAAGTTQAREIHVTASAGRTFNFLGLHLYASLTSIPFEITGLRQSAVVFSETGLVPWTHGNFQRLTFATAHHDIDTLVIRLTNQAPACCLDSMGLDNVVLRK